MSSANFFTGYSSDKPSSKVLNPPGGRSNNIFGSVEENTNANACNKNKNQTSSIFFGDDSTPQQLIQEQQARQQHHMNAQAHRQKSSVFGEDPAKENNRDNRRGFNPITGKPYEEAPAVVATAAAVVEPQQQQQQQQPQQHHQQPEEPQQKQLHTSSRVLQPPGGKSHGLW
jgi:hypothetical protein